MMALHVGPQRKTKLAGILGYSGLLADPGHWTGAAQKPPVMLIHGDRDELIPVVAVFSARAGPRGGGNPGRVAHLARRAAWHRAGRARARLKFSSACCRASMSTASGRQTGEADG